MARLSSRTAGSCGAPRSPRRSSFSPRRCPRSPTSRSSPRTSPPSSSRRSGRTTSIAMMLPWVELVAALALIVKIRDRAAAVVASGRDGSPSPLGVAWAWSPGPVDRLRLLREGRAEPVGAEKLLQNVGCTALAGGGGEAGTARLSGARPVYFGGELVQRPARGGTSSRAAALSWITPCLAERSTRPRVSSSMPLRRSPRPPRRPPARNFLSCVRSRVMCWRLRRLRWTSARFFFSADAWLAMKTLDLRKTPGF